MIRKLFDIRAIAFALLLAFVSTTVTTAPGGDDVLMPDSKLVAYNAPSSFFPMGWFDHLNAPERLAGFKAASMNAVVPYDGDFDGRVRNYLDNARKLGIKVFVQIDQFAVMTMNAVLVRQFVSQWRNHPAVYGWLLIDEPTLHFKYSAVTPKGAAMLYNTIKAIDPKRPVGIAFGVTEQPRDWLDAMDVLMYDDYVQGIDTPEFVGLGRWRARLQDRGSIAASRKLGYMPILQAFGQDSRGNAQIHKRLPTTKEMRYNLYTAIQYNATGVFFWVRYRSRPDWINKVMTPLSKEIAPGLRAFAARPISGATPVGNAVKWTLFRDPTTGNKYLVAVHHGAGTVKAQVNLSSALKVTKATAKDSTEPVTGGKLIDSFGPYGARMYRLT